MGGKGNWRCRERIETERKTDIERKRDEMIHLGPLGLYSIILVMKGNIFVQSSIHASIQHSFTLQLLFHWGISQLKSPVSPISLTLSCLCSPLHPPPSLTAASSLCFPRLNAPLLDHRLELWGLKQDMWEEVVCMCEARGPTLIMFKGLTSLVWDIASHQHCSLSCCSSPSFTGFISPLASPHRSLPSGKGWERKTEKKCVDDVKWVRKVTGNVL